MSGFGSSPNALSLQAPPASLAGRWIILRPISRSDYQTFFGWRTDLLQMHIWGSSRRLPSWEEFCEEVEQMLRQSTIMLVLNKSSGLPIGFVQAYNTSPADGWCFTSAYIAEDHRQRPHAAEAYIALLEYLFRAFPLRKVYADVSDFNIAPLKPLMAGGFVEEGRFEEHTWHDDRYWDVIRLALRWLEVRDRARLLLGVAEETAELMEEQAQREATAADADGHRP